MTGLFALGLRRVLLPVGAALSALLIAACQTQPVKPAEPAPQTDTRYEALSEEKKALEKSLAKSEASRKDLEEKISDIQLRLLEKDSQIKALEEQLKSQQKALDDAFLEVVRSKAKLRSLETKAEAASNMAEAEIAVKALKTESGAGDQDADVRRAEQLLKMSADEFNNENYGGALYLTNQAKPTSRRLKSGSGPEKGCPLTRVKPSFPSRSSSSSFKERASDKTLHRTARSSAGWKKGHSSWVIPCRPDGFL